MTNLEEDVFRIIADNVLPHDDNIYRVHINPDTYAVKVKCFGMEGVDSSVAGTYSCVDNLPLWMQKRLAVLTMTRPPDVQMVDGALVGIGKRISKDVYWVFRS